MKGRLLLFSLSFMAIFANLALAAGDEPANHGPTQANHSTTQMDLQNMQMNNENMPGMDHQNMQMNNENMPGMDHQNMQMEHDHGSIPNGVESTTNWKVLGAFGAVNLGFILIGIWNKVTRRRVA